MSHLNRSSGDLSHAVARLSGGNEQVESVYDLSSLVRSIAVIQIQIVAFYSVYSSPHSAIRDVIETSVTARSKKRKEVGLTRNRASQFRSIVWSCARQRRDQHRHYSRQEDGTYQSLHSQSFSLPAYYLDRLLFQTRRASHQGKVPVQL